VKAGHVDDIVERAAGRLQHGHEIVEGKLDLLFEDRLWRPVLAAADLARGKAAATLAALTVASLSDSK
jgi:hypothetical protein